MEEYVAMVKLFAGPYAPQGYMPCNGQLLPIAQYQELFSLFGNAYGGNGTTTFALPTLEAPVQGMTYVICAKGPYPSRP